jgi:hypothetical protein
MAAPTKLCDVKIVLANPEPSTHGTSETCGDDAWRSARGGNPDIERHRPRRGLTIADLSLLTAEMGHAYASARAVRPKKTGRRSTRFPVAAPPQLYAE